MLLIARAKLLVNSVRDFYTTHRKVVSMCYSLFKASYVHICLIILILSDFCIIAAFVLPTYTHNLQPTAKNKILSLYDS